MEKLEKTIIKFIWVIITHYTIIHNCVKLNWFHFSGEELKDIGYDFIKEWNLYEIASRFFFLRLKTIKRFNIN